MSSKSIAVSVFIFAAIFSNRFAQADNARYAMAVGDNPIYEMTVKAELPDSTKSTTDYVVYQPLSVDATNGQCTMVFDWGIKEADTTTPNGTQGGSPNYPDWLFNRPENPNTSGREIVIDPAGAVVSTNANGDFAQLEIEQGPAWQLPLQPLPPAGQNTWTTQRQITLYRDETPQGPPGFPRFPRPFGFANQNRIQTPANETITYTAAAPQGNLLTIQRHYDLTSLEKQGETPVEHMHGDGSYVFDTQLGRVVSLRWNLTDDIAGKNLNLTVPITVSAHLVAGTELAKIKSVVDARVAQQKKEAAIAEQEHGKLIDNVRDLPSDMELTKLMGTTRGGGDFMQASAERRPVIGFRIEVDDWGDRLAFRTFECLYSKPSEPPHGNERILLAKDGYAVSSVTINAGEFANALCVRFMKINGNSLDPQDTYVSQWFGRKIGESQTKLGGDGRFVYGIYGRKGLNVDAIGLVMGAGGASDAAVDDSTK